MLGHELVGSGKVCVIVLNDWMGDTSTWDGARPYLDLETFTWAFADLRGYGRSREQPGRFDLQEAAGDVLALADGLGWERFSLVGHSMSTLVALHLSQHHPARITRTVLVTPPPPTGFGADDATLESLRAVARGDDQLRLRALQASQGNRLSAGWLKDKLSRWRASASPDAVAAYAEMFARRGLSDPHSTVEVPVMAVTGEQDAEPMRSAAVQQLLAPLCARLTVKAIVESGHYPMQETPPLLVALVERFLAGDL